MADNRYRTEQQAPGQNLAIAAQSLYLANLLILPGIAFLGLFWLWKVNANAAPLARNHLRQTLFVSLWGALLLAVSSTVFIAFGGLQSGWTWVAVILYFTCIHSTLVVFGMFGLARAMAGRPFRFPLIGPRLEEGEKP